MYAAAVSADYHARLQRDVEDERRASLDRLTLRLPPSPHKPPAAVLPDLNQVGGWSKADPGSAGLAGRAAKLRRTR